MSLSERRTSAKKNFAYNIAYQILAIALPFVTAPYLSRVLGAEALGTYTYSYSIASYFLLFTTLGMANHGNRSVAATPRDRKALGEVFCNNYVIQLACGCVTFAVYVAYCMTIMENKLVAAVQGLVVLSGALDINWLFYGLEEFKLTVTRNAICKVLAFAAIFAFVKARNDLWVYALIMSLSLLASQVIMWGFLRKRVELVRPTWPKVRKNIKPVLVLFVPILSYSIYMLIDKVQLGQLASLTEVGYYGNAEKIMNIPTAIVTALSTVMLPRATKVLAEHDDESYERGFLASFAFVAVVEGFLCFGISSVATLFAPIYFGSEFVETGYILQFLIFAPLISGFANVIRTQYLIPKFKDRVYVISTIAAAVVNFGLNLMLIPSMKSMGAVVGTLCAESAVLVIQALAVRKELPWRYIAGATIPYLLVAMTSYVFIALINLVLPLGDIGKLAFDVLLGGCFYGVLLAVVARRKRDYVWALIERMLKRLGIKGEQSARHGR